MQKSQLGHGFRYYLVIILLAVVMSSLLLIGTILQKLFFTLIFMITSPNDIVLLGQAAALRTLNVRM